MMEDDKLEKERNGKENEQEEEVDNSGQEVEKIVFFVMKKQPVLPGCKVVAMVAQQRSFLLYTWVDEEKEWAEHCCSDGEWCNELGQHCSGLSRRHYKHEGI